MECPSCRSDTPDTSKFCISCGAALEARCPSCGRGNRRDAKFCAECGQKLSAAKAETTSKTVAAPTAPSPLAAPSPERRQLTVMFCDLVGSTALSARLDPEDLREIIGTYHHCCAEQITNAGGFVAKYMGDGVLAYFGYPRAHEDDAERAVGAGLVLVEAVPKLRAGHDAALQVRVGIATGVVVVGDLIGEGAAREQGVVGDTPNLAARLQSLAEPGQVVISQSARRLTGGLFSYRDLGRVAVKGLADPVQAWEVTGATAVQSRFEAHHGAALTPLVGREEELELLLRRWRQAKGGEGRVVLLSGEPGIGKSRLTVALEERLQNEPHTRLRYFCAPHHTDSALYPVIAQLERAAGLERQDAPEVRLDKLASLLRSPLEQDTDVRLVAELLSIPSGNRYPSLNWSAQRKKEKTLEVLLHQLEVLSGQQPVLMEHEDVHWIDPSSRELLDIMVERVARLPVLLLITFRPEFAPPWTGQAHVTTMTLSRLGRREGAVLVQRLSGENVLPDEITAEIVERTDGVPLFVEELTKAVLEAGMRSDGVETAVSTTPPSALAVPATLHASLMARLDRLGTTAKEIAQIGAAIGREFSYELLNVVAQKSEEEVRTSLGRLSDAGLLLSRGVPPQTTFLFKHALVRDAAYGTVLRGSRQQLHARIAGALEERWPEVVETQPELLAQHFTEAGLADRALEYWRQAGERALQRSANLEGASHFRRGLKLLEALADQRARSQKELQLLIAYGPALMMTQSSAAPEVGLVYARARELARETGRSADLFLSVWGSWLSAWSCGDAQAARRLVDELFDIARSRDDPELLLQANHAAWPMGMIQGAFDEAWQQVEVGLSLYRRDEHAHHARLYGGHDPGTCGYACGAIIRISTGHLDHAVRLSEQGLALARDLAHPPSLAHALWFAAEVRQNPPRAERSARVGGKSASGRFRTRLRSWDRECPHAARVGASSAR